MARDDTDYPRIESVSRNKQVDRIFCGLYRFCCAPRREHFKIMLSIRTRPALFVHALSVFGMRSWLSFRFGVHDGNMGQRGVLTQANGLFFLALSYILPMAFAQVASMIARVRVGDSEYQTNCLSRWWRILLIQFAVLVSALFSPGGAPSWLPIISVNILVLAILFESLLGTIKERNLENWSSKYHVVLLTMFSVPLFLVTVFELVAMAVSSPLTFGQVHMQNVGATGGTSNQMLGSVNSNGWWFGLSDETMMWVSMTCYFGMLASLIVLPHLLVLVGFRGPKAPQYLAKILHKTGGHVPLLSRENHFHFFITKHEKHKELALKIAKALSDANFKVWLSQTEAIAGRSIEKNGMQEGVRRSESLLLLMTRGIFHADRFWVTKTEVSYGVLQHNKPLICLSPTIDEGGFKFEDKCQGLPGADGRVHPKGCCHSVHESFQPFARAIPIALDVVKTWQYSNSKESGITVSRTESETMRYLVVEIVKRYLLRDSAKKRLMRELEVQAQLGACGEVEVAPQMTGMAKEKSHDEETKAHSSAGMENVVSRFNIG